ncbi:MAG: hypothetical protein ACR2KF_00450 [Nitrososphaeraceae archaeon]
MDPGIVYFIFRFSDMNNGSFLKYLKLNLNLFITLITLVFILVPSFALISFSQSNDTLSEATLSNESSFSSLSRDLAENQTESDDQSDQETGPED